MPLAAAIGPVIAGIGGAAASIYGAVNQGNAVNNASQAQQQANAAAIAEQRRQFDVNQGNLQPFLQGGHEALNAQLELLGLGGTGGGAQGGAPNFTAYVQNNPDLLAAYQANPGSQTMDQFGQWHWGHYGQDEYTNGGRAYSPFGAKDMQGASPGVQGQPGQTGGPGAQGAQAAIDAIRNGPVFKSISSTGEDAILAHGAATGGLRGGNTENSLARFRGDALAQLIQQQFQNLGQVAGQGQQAGTNLSTLGQSTAGNVGNLIGQGGAYQAGGILGSANANNQIANTISGLPSIFGNSSFMNALGLGQRTQVSPQASPLGPQYNIPAQGVQPGFSPLQLDQSLSLPAW